MKQKSRQAMADSDVRATPSLKRSIGYDSKEAAGSSVRRKFEGLSIVGRGPN